MLPVMAPTERAGLQGGAPLATTAAAPAAPFDRPHGSGHVAMAPALCVSIHDVAPDTWPACLTLLAAVRAVAPQLPLSWLVVPCFHGRSPPAPAMDAMLGELLRAGHELVLHGYTHLDDAAPAIGVRCRLLRQVYTTGEGEFAAIGRDDALRRLDLGLAWFAKRGWPVEGFVPPAWLAGSGARAAVRQRPFRYTTSLRHFYLLSAKRSVCSPSLVYMARNGAGRSLSPPLADALAAALTRSALVRFALHPADAQHPALLRHAQRLLEKLLSRRQPMTKRDFAALYAQTPAPHRAPGSTASG